MNIVFKDNTSQRPLNLNELKEIAGDWFGYDRIEGEHCSCEGNGEFVLLPYTDPAVIEGGKNYMKCRNCGEYSHL